MERAYKRGALGSVKMNRKAMGTNQLNVILIVINVILLVAVVIVWMNSGKEEKVQTTTIGESEIGVGAQQPTSQQFETNKAPLTADVRLCSSIDENYNCNEIAKFNTGNTIYLITTVSGFEQIDTDEGWLTGIRQNITTTDETGNILERMTKRGIETADYTETKQDIMTLTNKFETLLNTDAPGKYTLKFEITDRITGEKITGQKMFEME